MYNGVTYTDTEFSVQAPFTPTRTMYDFTLWQANDPLVHYLASDLNCIMPGRVGLLRSDLVPPILPSLNLNQVGLRYQPWGLGGQMQYVTNVDTNAYNLAYRDPLVWGSDYWNFPTGQTWNPNWLGQVHRGTPWQTIYLKSPNICEETGAIGSNIGTNTWEIWTGNTNWSDAEQSIPADDWHLAGLLTALLNTNASAAFFSINNPDPNAWAALFDGLTAVTNSSPYATIVLSSNSPAVFALGVALEAMRASQYQQEFHGVGDILATPQLTVQSPFLNWTNLYQRQYGISDAAYEAIPSQLLAQLGVPSVGTVVSANGQSTVQFTGGAGHCYVVQVSADLVHWTNLATNSPVNGQIDFTLPATTTGTRQFYRSVLWH